MGLRVNLDNIASVREHAEGKPRHLMADFLADQILAEFGTDIPPREARSRLAQLTPTARKEAGLRLVEADSVDAVFETPSSTAPKV